MTQDDKHTLTPDDVLPNVDFEFSRPVDVTSFGSKGRHFKFQSTGEERQALADRYLILSVDTLEAKCKIAPARKGSFKLEGTFEAVITQACGISLEPLEDKISGSFSVSLQQGVRQNRKETPEIEFSLDEEDIEFMESNLIDVGEVIAQHLSLEINPYPRKEGATGKELGKEIIQEEDVDLVAEKKNPFAVLKSLKHKT